MTASSRKEHHLRLLVAAILARSCSPRPPLPPRRTSSRTGTSTGRDVGVCGFPVLVHSEGVFTAWQYLDETGTVVRERWHVERAFTVTWTNPANGKSISSVLGGPVFTEYFADGSITQVVAGRERLFIARGEGPVAMQVGRIVFHVDPAGTETVPFATPQWDLDINPELCAYLA